MKVLFFDTKEARDNWNAQGLPLGPQDVTRRRFDVVREKQGQRRYGALVDEADETKLTGLEQAALHSPYVAENFDPE